MTRKGFILNEDSSHYFMYREADQMTPEALRAFIDQYAGTQVSHLFFNVNAQTTSYASNVWDRIWDGDPATAVRPHEVSLLSNTRLLFSRGIDPYAIWIERARKQQIAPWISMRMNDCHFNDQINHYIHSNFWRRHPEYWRVQDRSAPWNERAFDYGHKAVREYHFKLIEEILERYDLDGIELDWMRECHVFRPGREHEGAPLLTELMREVRRLTESIATRRGHAIGIAVRVPAHPQTAIGFGLDAVRWCKMGLVDLLIPSARWQSADFDIPVDFWNDLLGSARDQIRLAPGLEVRIQAYPQSPAFGFSRLETLCGFSAAMLHRGADQIYLFNHMDNGGAAMADLQNYPTALCHAGAMETVLRQPRRHIMTFVDVAPPGVAANCLLPQQTGPQSPMQARLYCGPAQGIQKVTMRIGLNAQPGFAEAKFHTRLNSTDCTALADHKDLDLFPGAKRVIQFECLSNALLDGYNLIECWPCDSQMQMVTWAELALDPSQI